MLRLLKISPMIALISLSFATFPFHDVGATSRPQTQEAPPGAPRRPTPKMSSGEAPTRREASEKALIQELLGEGATKQEILLLLRLDSGFAGSGAENVQVFKPGEEAFLIGPTPLFGVYVYPGQADFLEAAALWGEKSLESFRAADAELDRRGKRLYVSYGTKVLVMETAVVRPKGENISHLLGREGYPLLKVKLLESSAAGKIVWVEKMDVSHWFRGTEDK